MEYVLRLQTDFLDQNGAFDQGRNFRKAMQQGRQLFFLPWGASIRDTYPEHRVEHMDALKGVVHPQNDIFSNDYSCHGHLSSMVFFCICRILFTKNVFK